MVLIDGELGRWVSWFWIQYYMTFRCVLRAFLERNYPNWRHRVIGNKAKIT